jgi:hypothetical protein
MAYNLKLTKDIVVYDLQNVRLTYTLNDQWSFYINIPKPIVVLDILKLNRQPPNEIFSEHINHNLNAFKMIENFLAKSKYAVVMKYNNQYAYIVAFENLFTYGNKIPVRDIISTLKNINSPASLLMSSKAEWAKEINFSTPSSLQYNERCTVPLSSLATILFRK